MPINIRNVNGNDVRGGGGFKLRVGETFRFADLRVTPEIGYGFTHLFANDDAGDPAYDWNLHRAFAGVRFGFGRFVVPVVYGHVGYGWRATNDPIIPQASGFAYDAGVALDLHLLPHFGFGAHAEVAGHRRAAVHPAVARAGGARGAGVLRRVALSDSEVRARAPSPRRPDLRSPPGLPNRRVTSLARLVALRDTVLARGR